jgi:hypothetical protein
MASPGPSAPMFAAAAGVSFNRQIRPLLAENCLKCHGGVKEAGELNLQFRDSALKGGKSHHPAVVPGKPEESEFMVRLTASDPETRMPKNRPALDTGSIALIKQWIAEGARWEKHWAYEPPRRTGKGIDATVEAHLAQEKLSLSPSADRWTLARRTALDLTGLPPTPESVEAFVKDTAPDAYERWVEGLLASPAYGERWASVWLDLARYSDSKGYEKDGFRDMWRYRDWVVDAFNADMPYDEFLVEQLAGDLLPNPTEDQIIATAFHRNTPENDEGGTDDEEFRTYAVLDRLSTTFDALQGTTMGCVQCHGHPYDPFVHTDYYRLLAFFNNTADADRDDSAPTRRFRARVDSAKAAALEQQIATRQKQLEAAMAQPDNRQAFESWLQGLRPPEDVTQLEKPTVSSSEGDYVVKENGQVLLKGGAPSRTTITVESPLPAGTYYSLVLETLPDASLPNRGPGAAESGNFILTRVRMALVLDGKPIEDLEFTNAYATHEQPGWPVAEALRDAPHGDEGENGWAVGGGIGKAQTAGFVLPKPLEAPAGARVRVTLACQNDRWRQHVIGAFRLGVGRSAVPAQWAALPQEIRQLIARERSKWTPEERAKMERHFFSGLKPELADMYTNLDRDREALKALPACTLPIMRELTGKDARVTRVFHRGNWMDKAEVVQPAVPAALNPWHDEYPTNRLGFARWLTSLENPLTARVHVNRVWEQLFGIGLVETLEDFGSQGDKPVYQDLLDDLAAWFQTDLKWSQKRLLREIVLSRVYQQTAKAAPALVERDPANRLLARGPRFRLASEQLRDQSLFIGGLLSRKMFGPPVMPYQPPGMWLTPYEGRDWVISKGEDRHRRGLYTFIRRSATYPSFITFDSPNREYCVVRRLRTNTPLQSLDLLNSPVFFEAAEGLAKRMVSEGGASLEGQIARGLVLALQRPARPDQVKVLEDLYPKAGNNLTLVANAILNLDEVLNKN